MVAVWRVWDEMETVENRMMAVMMTMTVVGVAVMPWVIY